MPQVNARSSNATTSRFDARAKRLRKAGVWGGRLPHIARSQHGAEHSDEHDYRRPYEQSRHRRYRPAKGDEWRQGPGKQAEDPQTSLQWV
jgi:hypothetical protein